jgi:hypothetical protein
MTAASVFIASLALLFTVGSFWWLNARRGRLVCAPPHAFGMAATPQVFRIRFPLAIYNTGARAIIVRDLRCRFPGTEQLLPLPWESTRHTLRPKSEDFQDVPTPFPVRGREAVPVIAEFGGPFPGFTLAGGAHRCVIEIVDSDRGSWRTLLAFEVHVTDREELRSAYLSYPNRPHADPVEKDRADAAVLNLLQHFKARSERPQGPDRGPR